VHYLIGRGTCMSSILVAVPEHATCTGRLYELFILPILWQQRQSIWAPCKAGALPRVEDKIVIFPAKHLEPWYTAALPAILVPAAPRSSNLTTHRPATPPSLVVHISARPSSISWLARPSWSALAQPYKPYRADNLCRRLPSYN
jgi:hypothetical protein